MRMMKVIFPVVLLGLCGGTQTRGVAEETKPVREYAVRGIVRQPLSEDGTVVVEHEDVPGLMPGMTMPFRVRETGEAKGLKPGDGVAFTLFLAEKNSWIGKISRIDPTSVEVSSPAQQKPISRPAAQRVREGDVWPSFELVNQTGKTLRSADFAGKHTLLNFIFTRCAVTDFCPLLTRNFGEIHSVLRAKGLDSRVRMLSISFDPKDTPDVLRQYANANGAAWTFATGQPTEIEKLTRAFAVRVESEGGTYNHGLCTALIGPDQRIQQIWRGNAWKPQEVLEVLQSAFQKTPAADLANNQEK